MEDFNKLTLLAINIFIIASINSLQLETPIDLISKVNYAIKCERNSTIKICSYFKENIDCSEFFKYRSITGICNNKIYKNQGARGDAFIRLLNPDYNNGISSPRSSSSTNYELPDPDKVSKVLQNFARDKLINTNVNVNELLAAWGILISNDLVEISSISTAIDCCSGKINFEDKTQCYVNNENCINYHRSSPSISETDCLKYQRNQMNVATGFLDASNIYADEKFSNNGYITLDNCALCNVNGIVGTIHKIIFTEHNRIAEKLMKINILWDHNKIFYESRKIVIAQIQHITYNEFLPALLGTEILKSFDLGVNELSNDVNYLELGQPGVYNEFGIVALPTFHSLLRDNWVKIKFNLQESLDKKLKYNSLHWKTTNINKFSQFGFSVHQGRDHGIPAYQHYLNLCSKRNISFDEFGFNVDDVYNKFNVSLVDNVMLSQLYKNINNIDLVAGISLEKSSVGSLFGPTLSCILGHQFRNLKITDRFWYTNKDLFSKEQLESIKKVTFSNILCENVNATMVHLNSFMVGNENNPNISCEEMESLNLDLWRSEDDLNNYELSDDRLEENYFSKSTVLNAIQKAENEVFNRNQFEYLSWVKNGAVDAKSPDGTAASFSKANKNALLIANTSLLYELTSREILNSVFQSKRRKRQIQSSLENIEQNHIIETLQTLDVSKFIAQKNIFPNFEENCDDTSTCNANNAFRSLSGRCNNIENSNWGQSLTVFSRLLPPQYEDGISKPRITSISGSQLPNPRVISTLIHPDISNLHTRFSLMVMQYAQFIDHDLTLTPIHKGFHESIPSCRKCNSPQTVHPECNPFPVPPGDHYYPEVNITSGEQLCFPFMRSLPGQQILGPRQQINQNTAYLDGSQIYGENICVGTKLRGFSGRLNSTVYPNKGKELLPQSPFHPECKSLNGLCFIAGDDRASEQPGLTAIHTIFLREHNRIVEGLRGVNPHWNGDQLYENARKIVIAQTQHITYNEFLPRILSWNAVNLYGLKLLPSGYYKEYNQFCSGAVFNEFAAAAFRIGHSLLRPHIPRLNSNHHPVDPPLLLRDGFFKVDSLLQPGIIDEISRGLVATPMETLDQFITGEVTNHLFEDRRIPFSGIDLIALNIQRARDHGVPSYNNYRALCNLKRARTWQDLNREIPPEVIARFKKIYQSVEDIDLFPGAMTERPLQGGLVGPTLACIIGIQFRQLRKCDRFWYENNGFATRFSEAQLTEIRKSSLSKVICENLEVQGEMQRAAFDLPTNFLNPRVACQSMPQIDLGKWRESAQECLINGRNIKIGESAFPSPCTSCVCTPEGSQCASLRVTDCLQLEKEWTREEIQRDEICSSQCRELLQNNSFSNVKVNPTFARAIRSQIDTNFQFPNLTKYLTPF